MEEAQWKEKLRKANAAATASEERQRQEAIQLAINLGYRSNSTSTTVVEDEDVAENFDVSSIFTWKSLNSGDTVLRDHLKANGIFLSLLLVSLQFLFMWCFQA